MSDPQNLTTIATATTGIISCSDHIQWASQAIGASLAIIGGFVAVIVRLRLEKKNELDCLKIILADEISEIADIIGRMVDVHSSTDRVPKLYINELSENFRAYENVRQRIFLFGDSALRKHISELYKKLNAEIKKFDDTVGSLKEDSDQVRARADLIVRYKEIKENAVRLKTEIENYTYRPLFIL